MGLITSWQEFIAVEDDGKARHLRRVTLTGRAAVMISSKESKS